MPFVPVTAASREAQPDDLWIPVRGKDVGHAPGGGWLTVADAGDATMVCVGTDGERLVWTGEAAAVGSYTPWTALAADPAHGPAAVVRAVQVVGWRAAHRYCGSCAAPLLDCPGFLSRRCPICEQLYLVRLGPVALVMVTSGDKLLLVRHSYAVQHMWALVSGYLESGESLEDAARREVAEEVGLSLSDLTYAGSAPSAFGDPDVLLAGFRAEAAGTEVRVDPAEIAEARWFTRDEVAALGPEQLPPAGSLPVRMIAEFLKV
ncbi:NUDIX domain-containing protein [Phytomonospora sp. NPDC050363]|uniref:NAD(+) diphosphatase n=1 Tax=Phytomonospora sp. NPDC050363 TaxID=3155642 RepID=UPI0033D5074D